MINNESISVIIPAYNEQDRIGLTLENLLSLNLADEIIVINDGSEDNTDKIVRSYPVKLINYKKNQGKGRAVEIGIQQSSGDILAMLDADLVESVVYFRTLLDAVLNNGYEISIGVLPIKGGGLGMVRKLADYTLRKKTCKVMKAPLSGQRVFRRSMLKYFLPLNDDFSLEIGMDLAIIRNNINYIEIECDFQHRVTGKDIKGIIHRSKQFIEILKVNLNVKE